ncbi:MAG: alpha/beta hydrolase [Candidatus Gastranaerophilales bacterium]|nr:alpha/beta hydrolase [Candidatus Gastranaerophilales bacterium]
MTEPSSKHPHLSKYTEKFIYKISSVSSTPMYELTPDEARSFLTELQLQSPVETNAGISDTRINTDYEPLSIRVIRPKDKPSEKLPAIFYLHGGGWILGDKDTHNTLICKLAEYSQSAVIFPQYSRSPELSYPVAIDQCFNVLKYISENPEEFNIDNDRIALAGDSAGGNMAAVLALMAKNNNINLKYLALFYPVTNADMNTKSYNDFKDGPWLSKKAMEWFWNAYVPDKQMRSSVYISPLKSNEAELSSLPSTLVITAENDVLRDEGEDFARKLANAGVNVYSIRVNFAIHDFLMLNALYQTTETNDTLFIAGNLIKHYVYA